MTRIRRAALALALLNLAILPLQFALPNEAAGFFHNPPPPDNDCCKTSQEGVKYCCDQCCQDEDCDNSEECQTEMN